MLSQKSYPAKTSINKEWNERSALKNQKSHTKCCKKSLGKSGSSSRRVSLDQI